MSGANSACTSCYGSGELVTEEGARACPDCFGDGKPGAKVEWRLRQIERLLVGSGGEIEGDIQWLLHELRSCRGALLQILTLCMDAPAGDSLARDIRFKANEALGIYAPEID